VIGRLHHIGYAVAGIRSYRESFLDPLFGPVEMGEIHEDPIQGVRVAFVSVGSGPLIELIEPVGSDSPVSRIIGSARGGLYHLGYEVDDLDREIERFRGQKCLPLGRPVRAVAFEGRRIVFLLTPHRDLIELIESAGRPGS
jgi:methylmalonyl-CoA/ethylmalonyl-CoA epimerase